MIALIDTHCHLDAAEFAADRVEVLARARQAGIDRQILPAVSAAAWPTLRELATTVVDLYPAYGLHPMFLAEHLPEHLDHLAQWLAHERPIAVGEAGLDFYVEDLDRLQQQHYFEAQLDLARQFDLPIILHARRAVDAVIAGIRRCKPPAGVIHSYAGSAEQARQLERLGFKLGFGGPLTYPRALRLHELVASLPLSMLLIETDAPDQPLHGYQGLRNEPARLVQVLQAVAELRQMPHAELAEALNANAVAVFGPRIAGLNTSGGAARHLQQLQSEPT